MQTGLVILFIILVGIIISTVFWFLSGVHREIGHLKQEKESIEEIQGVLEELDIDKDDPEENFDMAKDIFDDLRLPSKDYNKRDLKNRLFSTIKKHTDYNDNSVEDLSEDVLEKTEHLHS